jgi:hypothetical protein
MPSSVRSLPSNLEQHRQGQPSPNRMLHGTDDRDDVFDGRLAWTAKQGHDLN